MARPRKTWGFRDKETAEDARNLTGNRDQEYIEGRVRGGGGGGSKFYVAKLTADFSTVSTPGSATCTIYDPSDETTSIATGVTVYGNLDMFDDLVTDDYATCVKAQDGEYYMVNAPCGASGSATAELDGGTA